MLQSVEYIQVLGFCPIFSFHSAQKKRHSIEKKNFFLVLKNYVLLVQQPAIPVLFLFCCFFLAKYLKN